MAYLCDETHSLSRDICIHSSQPQDLKLENVLLAKEEDVLPGQTKVKTVAKLADFGLHVVSPMHDMYEAQCITEDTTRCIGAISPYICPALRACLYIGLFTADYYI